MNSYKAHMKKETRQTGFTLVELLVTMAVLIITLAVGVPFYNNIVNHNRVIALTNLFSSSVNLAKSEAVGRGNDVYICAAGACDDDGDTGADWNNGWFVFEDSDISTAGEYDSATDVMLKVWPAVDAGMRMDAFDSSNHSQKVYSLHFDYSGALISNGVDADFVMSEADSTNKIQTTLSYVRCISVNYSGRINQNTPESGDNGSFSEGTTTLEGINCP